MTALGKSNLCSVTSDARTLTPVSLSASYWVFESRDVSDVFGKKLPLLWQLI